MPEIVPDGDGNFYIAWRDSRSGVGQIYCQKLDGNGNAQWSTNGIAVCSTAWWQDEQQMVADSAGGVIIVWEDERNSILNSFIYGQRMDRSGNRLWTASGVPIDLSTGLKGHLSCIADKCGGAFLAWDSGTAAEYQNIFAQRIDSPGIILPTGTVSVCAASQEQVDPKLVLDGSGGSIITWLDKRNGRDDIYAQKVQPNGVPAWTSNGIMINLGPPVTGFN